MVSLVSNTQLKIWWIHNCDYLKPSPSLSKTYTTENAVIFYCQKMAANVIFRTILVEINYFRSKFKWSRKAELKIKKRPNFNKFDRTFWPLILVENRTKLFCCFFVKNLETQPNLWKFKLTPKISQRIESHTRFSPI